MLYAVDRFQRTAVRTARTGAGNVGGRGACAGTWPDRTADSTARERAERDSRHDRQSRAAAGRAPGGERARRAARGVPPAGPRGLAVAEERRLGGVTPGPGCLRART